MYMWFEYMTTCECYKLLCVSTLSECGWVCRSTYYVCKCVSCVCVDVNVCPGRVDLCCFEEGSALEVEVEAQDRG